MDESKGAGSEVAATHLLSERSGGRGSRLLGGLPATSALGSHCHTTLVGDVRAVLLVLLLLLSGDLSCKLSLGSRGLVTLVVLLINKLCM